MNNLYLVSRSPFQRTESLTNIQLAEKGDGVAFIQDGVLVSKETPTWLSNEIEKLKERGVKLYLLKEDLEARGLAGNEPFEMVDYDGFSDLIVSYERIIS